MQQHTLYTIIIRDKRDSYLIDTKAYPTLEEAKVGYQYWLQRYPKNVIIKIYAPGFNLVSPDIFMQAE
jgi:hypothetical protein